VGRAPADLHPPLNKTKVAKVVVVEDRTQASEAKGPFPGGKRVGSWGKKVKAKVKVKKERVDMGKSGREKTEGEEL
jgi:hypothetical protein